MPTTSGTRLRPGDVLAVDCGSEVGLVGYVGKHPHFGDLLWVLPRLFKAPVASVCSQFDTPGYFQFFPATASVRHGLMPKIGFCAETMKVIPRQWCNMIQTNDDGTVRRWTLCDEHAQLPRETLSWEERTLPVGEIINLPMLVERLRAGWTPARRFTDG